MIAQIPLVLWVMPVTYSALSRIHLFGMDHNRRGFVGSRSFVLDEARGSEPTSFVYGIERDIEAVRAAITQPWTTSPVEEQIDRVQMIKRQMSGRAHDFLLKQRVLDCRVRHRPQRRGGMPAAQKCGRSPDCRATCCPGFVESS